MFVRALVGALAATLAMSCAVEVEDFNRVDTQITDTDPAPANSEVCDAHDVKITPTFVQGPVARTQPIAVRYRGYADDVTFTVAAAGREYTGETLLDARAAYFVPNYAWPAGAMVGFHVELCGAHYTGQFEVGAIMKRLTTNDLIETYIEQPYVIDMGRGDWDAPTVRRLHQQRLINAFGGSFFVEAERFGYEGLLVSLTPAVPGMDGHYVRDGRGNSVTTTLHNWSNPYAVAEFDAFTLSTRAGPITVYEPMLLLGFGPDGFADTRFVGVLDLVHAHGDDKKTAACDAFEEWSVLTPPKGSLATADLTGDAAIDIKEHVAQRIVRSATCQPCGYTRTATCVEFEVTGLDAVPPPGFPFPEVLPPPPLNAGFNPEYFHPDDPAGPVY